MTTEEKFRAAVNVIRSLPKDGSYSPSNELMLRFYAFFKQASEGPCQQPKPAFWEIVKKLKWESWKKLGNMSREEAMEKYVAELAKIVETMSYTDNVAKFLGSLDAVYAEQFPISDLELVVGSQVIDRVCSRPGSPFASSREASPHRQNGPNSAPRFTSSLETSPASSSCSASPLPPDPDDDDEEDEFIDTVESAPETRSFGSPPKIYSNGPIANGIRKPAAPRHQYPTGLTNKNSYETTFDKDNIISSKLWEAIQTLRQDLDCVTLRLRDLDLAQKQQQQQLSSIRKSSPSSRHRLFQINPTLAIAIFWPIIFQFLFTWLRQRSRRRHILPALTD